MEELRIPTVTFPAEIVCTDGRVFPGQMFAPASIYETMGARRASEMLNGPAAFFPFLPEDSHTPVMLNKQEIVMISVPDSPAAVADGEPPMCPTRLVEVECSGRTIAGTVSIDMPRDQCRVLDFLNRAESFLTLRLEDRHVLVRKSSIVCVTERDES